MVSAQKPKTRFFPQILFEPILSLYTVATSNKRIEIYHGFIPYKT